jgi:hypothetical protein
MCYEVTVTLVVENQQRIRATHERIIALLLLQQLYAILVIGSMTSHQLAAVLIAVVQSSTIGSSSLL